MLAQGRSGIRGQLRWNIFLPLTYFVIHRGTTCKHFVIALFTWGCNIPRQLPTILLLRPSLFLMFGIIRCTVTRSSHLIFNGPPILRRLLPPSIGTIIDVPLLLILLRLRIRVLRLRSRLPLMRNPLLPGFCFL
jgi:hypothetical protein